VTRTLAPAAVLALALSAAAAPVPKGASAAKPDPLYYAVRVGDKRVMTNPLGRTTTYTVTAVEPQPDGSLWVHEERDSGNFKRTEVLSVSPAGVYRAALVANGRVLKRDRGEYLVRPHRKGGTKWDHSIIPPDRFRQMLAKPAPGYRAEGNVLIGPRGQRSRSPHESLTVRIAG
jgi:hypothetical protein